MKILDLNLQILKNKDIFHFFFCYYSKMDEIALCWFLAGPCLKRVLALDRQFFSVNINGTIIEVDKKLNSVKVKAREICFVK